MVILSFEIFSKGLAEQEEKLVRRVFTINNRFFGRSKWGNDSPPTRLGKESDEIHP